jgi:CDP-paratose 2-epimerase
VVPVRDALLKSYTKGFDFLDADVCQTPLMLSLFRENRFDAIIHCAAQPSHDRAAVFPLVDFEINAKGTLGLLEANRLCSPEAPFVFMSTNKVYGDCVNNLDLVDGERRWGFPEAYWVGIPETFPIDQSKHSIFGASKLAADIMVQEYGRYFGMSTVCLRAGCLTGPGHAAVEQHGFLSYLVACNLRGETYTIYGYKGKQVRDNLHSDDVAAFIDCFLKSPKCAAVYNLGGGIDNSVSILEAFDLVSQITGKQMFSLYEDTPRQGDHMCYYSDLTHIREDYPSWLVSRSLNAILMDLVNDWESRLVS